MEKSLLFSALISKIKRFAASLSLLLLRQKQIARQEAELASAECAKTGAALRQCEERFQILASVTSDYAFSACVSPDGEFQYTLLTGAVEAITGYTPEELHTLGDWRTIIHPEDLKQDEPAISYLWQNQPVKSDVRIIRKNGEIRWVRVSTYPVWDVDENRLVGVNGSVRDITEQRASQDAILELSDELYNKTNQLFTFNDIARDISAVTDLSTTLNRVLVKLQAALPLDAFFVALYDSQAQTVTFPMMFDDSRFWQQETALLNQSGRVAQVLQIGQPILANRTMEEIKKLQAENQLEMRVGAVNRVSASILMAPLPIGHETIGVISVQSYIPNSYTEKHIDFLQGAAHQIAIAVQNARLYDSLQNELTARKRLESELQVHSQKLEQLVAERTQSLQRANEQLELILNTTSDALAFANPNGDIVLTNPAFLAMFDNRAKRYIEGIIASLEDNRHIEAVCESLLRVIYNREKQQLEAQIVSSQHGEMDVDLTFIPINNTEHETRSGVLLSGHNITHIKEVERFKARFVADAVHDLATPITGLSTRLYLLKRNPEKLADHIRSLENQVQHLRHLLDDLRTLSLIDRGQVTLATEKCNINELVDRVFDTYEPVAMDKHQSLKRKLSSNLPTLELDTRQIERALVNLVANAINYTAAHKEISVETLAEDGAIVIHITDEGMGISSDDIPYIFDRFYRTDEARQSLASGTGLGLAITKNIIELHDGSVSVTSEPGHGSTFTVRLPYSE